MSGKFGVHDCVLAFFLMFEEADRVVWLAIERYDRLMDDAFCRFFVAICR